MEDLEGPTSAAFSAGPPSESSPPSSPPYLDVTPVGSPDHDVPEIPSAPSDDEHHHDHDLGHDHNHEQEEEHEEDHDHAQEHSQEQSDGTAVLSEDLKKKIVKQVEFYFSDDNLPTDKYLMGFIKKNKEGFVPIAVIASFRKMKKITQDYLFIVAALQESSLLVVSSNRKKIKRLHPLPSTEIRDPKLYTVLVENLPEDHSVENIQRIFGAAGRIKNVSIRDPQVVGKSEKGHNHKADVLISSKLHALVEYETMEAAEKAEASLNDERDWRNGMRVKLLKNLGKYGQRRQHWRGSDSEKNSTGHISDHTGDEDIHNLSEHHDDTPDEEQGDHLSKEKTGNRGRNRGRPLPRRNKYHSNYGMGHGTTSSSHAVHSIETSKPPPGPRMPDGTRGFTMGRGRPPVSTNQS